jgi:hypothetical protein
MTISPYKFEGLKHQNLNKQKKKNEMKKKSKLTRVNMLTFFFFGFEETQLPTKRTLWAQVSE